MVRKSKFYWLEPTFSSDSFYSVTWCPFCDCQRHCVWFCDDVEYIDGILVSNNWFYCTDCFSTFCKIKDDWVFDVVLDEKDIL